jgi:hypothetical protein
VGEVKSLQLFNPDSGLGQRVKKCRIKRGYSHSIEKPLTIWQGAIKRDVSGMTQIIDLSGRPIKGKSHSIDDLQVNAGILRININGFYICTDI